MIIIIMTDVCGDDDYDYDDDDDDDNGGDGNVNGNAAFEIWKKRRHV